MPTKRKDGRFQESFSYNGKRYYVYADKKSEIADKIASKMDFLKNQREKHNNPTLDDYSKHFISVKQNSVKPSTIRNYNSWYKRASDVVLLNGIRFGDLKIQEIKPADLQAVQTSIIKSKASPRTTNGIMLHLSSIFDMAVLDETILKNPCKIIQSVKQDKKHARNTIHRALTEEETKLFFERATDSYYLNAFKFMLFTGMRIGEIGALTSADIDLKNNCIKVNKTVSRNELGGYVINDTAKTDAGNREIPLNQSILAVITAQKKLNAEIFGLKFKGEKRLFYSFEGGLLREYSVNREIKRICGKIKLDPITCHAFRATFATRFIEQRPQDYKTLSELLGHSNTKITLDLYTHVMNTTKTEAMKNINIAI